MARDTSFALKRLKSSLQLKLTMVVTNSFVFIIAEEAVSFPRGKPFHVGDMIPGYVLSVPDGSRGDVRCWDFDADGFKVKVVQAIQTLA